MARISPSNRPLIEIIKTVSKTGRKGYRVDCNSYRWPSRGKTPKPQKFSNRKEAEQYVIMLSLTMPSK